MIRYRNRKTGDIIERDEPQPVFDRSSRYERVSDGEPAAQAAGEPAETPLEERKRGELDELAASLGVEDPEALPNKAAVIEAIEAAQ